MREEGVVVVDKEAVGKLKVEVEEGRGRAESRWKRRGAAAALLLLLLLSGSRAEEGKRRMGTSLDREKRQIDKEETHTRSPHPDKQPKMIQRIVDKSKDNNDQKDY